MHIMRTEIGDFILANVEAHSSDIVLVTAHHFSISRQRAHTYIQRLITQGKIVKTGKTRDSHYYSMTGRVIEFSEKIRPGLAEDRVWTHYVRPKLLSLPENVYRICNYGFSEMYNNAIDHSNGTVIFTRIETTHEDVVMTIMDNGIGIFEKIQKALDLSSTRESILHLSKGKFTTDPAKHTGEGIFFTSRMFDAFSILSSDLYYIFKDEDWFLSHERREDFGKGTFIRMKISTSTDRTAKEIMDQYSDAEIGFGKTIVAVKLSADSDDPHISRSQAKRLLMGLERFRHIVLDFKRVEVIGPAFVDEVFRVFQAEHPDIKIEFIHANPDVEAMIQRTRSRM